MKRRPSLILRDSNCGSLGLPDPARRPLLVPKRMNYNEFRSALPQVIKWMVGKVTDARNRTHPPYGPKIVFDPRNRRPMQMLVRATDHLTGAETTAWSGAKQMITAFVTIVRRALKRHRRIGVATLKNYPYLGNSGHVAAFLCDCRRDDRIAVYIVDPNGAQNEDIALMSKSLLIALFNGLDARVTVTNIVVPHFNVSATQNTFDDAFGITPVSDPGAFCATATALFVLDVLCTSGARALDEKHFDRLFADLTGASSDETLAYARLMAFRSFSYELVTQMKAEGHKITVTCSDDVVFFNPDTFDPKSVQPSHVDPSAHVSKRTRTRQKRMRESKRPRALSHRRRTV